MLADVHCLQCSAQLFESKTISMKHAYVHIRMACLISTAFLLIPSMLSAHGVSQTDQEILTGGNLFAYIFVGAKHMLTGYDHLLFLVGMVFFLKNFRDIVQFVSFFTLGHSLTLIAATLLGVQANDHLIDAVIALSVLYKGFENLNGFRHYFKTEAPNLLYMVFGFGLIHGFGLSTRLQQLSVGNEATLSKIIAFNVGVELGQIIALIPILFLINQGRKLGSFATFQKSTNWGLVAAGIGLFIFQMVGFMGHLK